MLSDPCGIRLDKVLTLITDGQPIVSADIQLIRDQIKHNRERLGGYRSFAAKIGVGESWLYKFVQGGMPNPSHVTIQKLRDGLAAQLDS